MAVIALRPTDDFPAIAFRAVVYGVAISQGSKRAYPLKNGRIAMVDDNPRLDAWRERMMLEFRANQHRSYTDCRLPIDGPCAVTVTFYLPRPASAAKSRLSPATVPDVDKLARSCL
jgi:Holliday junction resolvase RusA-like endonuclease